MRKTRRAVDQPQKHRGASRVANKGVVGWQPAQARCLRALHKRLAAPKQHGACIGLLRKRNRAGAQMLRTVQPPACKCDVLAVLAHRSCCFQPAC